MTHEVDDSEHLSDPLDVASRSAQRLNDAAIADRQARLKRKRNPTQEKVDGQWPAGAWDQECHGCGDDIPLERLEVTGSDLCVHCADVAEKARGGYRV